MESGSALAVVSGGGQRTPHQYDVVAFFLLHPT
jgi:hypothetical protein